MQYKVLWPNDKGVKSDSWFTTSDEVVDATSQGLKRLLRVPYQAAAKIVQGQGGVIEVVGGMLLAPSAKNLPPKPDVHRVTITRTGRQNHDGD